MSGTALVTGATQGTGREAALGLAAKGWRVLIVGADSPTALATVEAIGQETGNRNLMALVADLTSLQAVRQLVGDVHRFAPELSVLVNASGGHYRRRVESADRIEMTLAANFLSAFLLTNLLLDRLKANRPSRIVVASSGAHQAGELDLGDLRLKRRYDGEKAFARAALCNVLFTYTLARHLEGSGVTVNCLEPDPAPIAPPRPGLMTMLFGSRAARTGAGTGGDDEAATARTPVFLAASPSVAGISGYYFAKCRPEKTAPASYDIELGDQLWREASKLTGLG
ncbi:MAG: SDR family NAD(P)-dependent oxidoreductase [Alphaproteobacteria bacterium]|nr:SDR family NAD(P)-dependent oxidoreductase [Alphaproteobacteria bacterium]